MHESPIALSILDTALDHAPAGTKKIKKITVAAGALSGIEKECLVMYFKAHAQGSIASDADIDLTIDPIGLICTGCGKRSVLDTSGPVEPNCRSCGAINSLDDGGRIYVKDIEIEK